MHVYGKHAHTQLSEYSKHPPRKAITSLNKAGDHLRAVWKLEQFDAWKKKRVLSHRNMHVNIESFT